VTLTLNEEPLTHDVIVLSAVADDGGNISNADFAPEEHDVGVAFTLVAVGETSGRVAQTVFWDSKPPEECVYDADCADADACNTDSCNGGKCQHGGGPSGLGTAVVTDVSADNGGCVQLDAKANGVDAWDVQQGKTYTVTLTKVTECSGESIEVIVKNSDTGNQTLTATGGNGTYTFTVTMPDPGCNTFPILYCTSGGDPSTGVLASDGDCQQAHLRAAIFGAGCVDPVQDTDCEATVQCRGQITGRKFSDYNAPNGTDDGEPGIGGVKVTLSGAANGCAITDATGAYAFPDLLPGTYTVTETPPAGQIATTETSCNVTIDENCHSSDTCNFGNVCLGSGGGLTLGFWSNKNGQSVMNDGGTPDPELTLLRALNLRNANGLPFDPTNHSGFKSWLLSASATNMSYMLSAQLSAMVLNNEAGFVSNGSYVYAPTLTSSCGYDTSVGFTTIGNLISIADAELAADGYTPSGDLNRQCQEIKKTALDNANNNRNFAVDCPDVVGNTCP
jgi:hypothetical protein